MTSSAGATAAPATGLSLSLIGVPNCGKTALFNRLTGSRQKVANYPGVTVERKEGRLIGPRAGRTYRVIDLPGAYSLEPTSLDEAIARHCGKWMKLSKTKFGSAGMWKVTMIGACSRSGSSVAKPSLRMPSIRIRQLLR